MLNLEIGDMTGGALQLAEETAAQVRVMGLLIRGRLKVIQEVELTVIRQSDRDLIHPAVPIRISRRIISRWSFELVERAVEDHAGRGYNSSPGMRGREVRIHRL